MSCDDVICTCGCGQNIAPQNLLWRDGVPYCPLCNQ